MRGAGFSAWHLTHLYGLYACWIHIYIYICCFIIELLHITTPCTVSLSICHHVTVVFPELPGTMATSKPAPAKSTSIWSLKPARCSFWQQKSWLVWKTFSSHAVILSSHILMKIDPHWSSWSHKNCCITLCCCRSSKSQCHSGSYQHETSVRI